MAYFSHAGVRVRAARPLCAAALGLLLAGCSAAGTSAEDKAVEVPVAQATDAGSTQAADESQASAQGEAPSEQVAQDEEQPQAGQASGDAPASATELRARLNITEDFRDSLIHGEKPADCQKYIVMHDTEGDGDASNIVDWWASNGNFVAAHYVVNKDGSIVQCVPIDKIAHHAGYGDAGHNEEFGVTDESRDDKRGTTPIGDWAPDYGMNSYSVGIEMVHVGASGEDYPEEQLRAVDGLIAYLDAYYGFESEIIDHNDWRTGNSDCSEEFQPYLRNLQQTRTHDGS